MRRAKRQQQPIFWWAIGFVSALLFLLGITLWMAGSVYSELPKPAELGPEYEPADVIVCLAGGRGRIRKALELYEKGYGKVLYISGTDRQVQMKEILKELQWVGPVDESHIILENISTNTIQNAEQVTRFVSEQGLKRVLLVTSVYHVRRATYIFRKILPSDVQLEVSWFEREPFESSVWWTQWNGIVVTVTEFFKFFYAWLRLFS
ncbi:MAG: YdcF family protein [Bdellovibrionota bacterium]